MTNEKVMEILNVVLKTERAYQYRKEEVNEAFDMAIQALEQQPKIGHWIDIESLDSALWHECSECGETEFYATNYCPNCGARMEVEE